MLHAPIGRLALECLILPDPATAVTAPVHVFVTPGVAATTNPAGNVSVKLASTGITLGLLMLKVRVEDTPTATVVRFKPFTIWSGSRMMMPTLAKPPLEAASPAPAV